MHLSLSLGILCVIYWNICISYHLLYIHFVWVRSLKYLNYITFVKIYSIFTKHKLISSMCLVEVLPVWQWVNMFTCANNKIFFFLFLNFDFIAKCTRQCVPVPERKWTDISLYFTAFLILFLGAHAMFIWWQKCFSVQRGHKLMPLLLEHLTLT